MNLTYNPMPLSTDRSKESSSLTSNSCMSQLTNTKDQMPLSRKDMGIGESIEEMDDSWLDEIVLFSSDPQRTIELPIRYNPLQVIPVYLSSEHPRDTVLHAIHRFLHSGLLPAGIDLQLKRRFLAKASRFFMKDGQMFRTNGFKPPLKVILSNSSRFSILKGAHEYLGHCGEQAVMHTLKERFYWPNMWNDIHHHVRSYHKCQIRSTHKIEIPLTSSCLPSFLDPC